MPHLTPDWRGLHPIIVHFSILLLLATPLLVLVSVGVSDAKRWLLWRWALALMVLGTAMTYVALLTGEAEREVVISGLTSSGLLEEHRSLGETTTELFSVLTLVFAALVIAHKLLEQSLDSWVTTSLLVAFLVFYGTGAVSLVDTARKGASLVQMLSAPTAVTCNLTAKGGR